MTHIHTQRRESSRDNIYHIQNNITTAQLLTPRLHHTLSSMTSCHNFSQLNRIMFARNFRRIFSSTTVDAGATAAATTPTPGQGVELLRFALNKDNLKYTAAIMAIGAIVAEITFVTYKVLRNDELMDAKFEKQEKTMDKKFDVINQHFVDLRHDMIAIMAITAVHTLPAEIAEQLASKRPPSASDGKSDENSSSQKKQSRDD